MLPARWPAGTKIVGKVGGGRWRKSAGTLLRDALTGDVTGDAQRVFGGRFAGHDVTVTKVKADGSALSVTADVRRGRRKVASVRRIVSDQNGTLVAEHGIRFERGRIRLSEVGARREDVWDRERFLRDYDRALDSWYAASGVSRVEVHATGDASYFWALQGGLDFRGGVPPAFVSRLETYAKSVRPLRRVQANALLTRVRSGESVTPADFAQLGGDFFNDLSWVGVRQPTAETVRSQADIARKARLALIVRSGVNRVPH